MEEKRKTKKEYFTEIKDLLVEKGEDRLAEVIDKEIALLDKKAMKSKERAAQRKAEGDELRDTISGILTEELQTAEEILEQIDDEKEWHIEEPKNIKTSGLSVDSPFQLWRNEI